MFDITILFLVICLLALVAFYAAKVQKKLDQKTLNTTKDGLQILNVNAVKKTVENIHLLNFDGIKQGIQHINTIYDNLNKDDISNLKEAIDKVSNINLNNVNTAIDGFNRISDKLDQKTMNQINTAMENVKKIDVDNLNRAINQAQRLMTVLDETSIRNINNIVEKRCDGATLEVKKGQILSGSVGPVISGGDGDSGGLLDGLADEAQAVAAKLACGAVGKFSPTIQDGLCNEFSLDTPSKDTTVTLKPPPMGC